MKRRRWFWAVVCIILWGLSVPSVLLYLINLRANLSMQELQAGRDRDVISRVETKLRNINSWIKVSSIFGRQGLNSRQDLLLSIFSCIKEPEILDPLEKISNMPDCAECHFSFRQNIRLAISLLPELKRKEAEHSLLINQIEQQKKQLMEQIDLHALLANDLAEILGSTSYYQSRGKSELNYYEDGPFKWLPKLDDKAKSANQGSGSDSAPLEVAQLAGKIENLRNQSRHIIDDYKKLKTSIDSNNIRRDNIESMISGDRKKIRDLLIEALKFDAFY